MCCIKKLTTNSIDLVLCICALDVVDHILCIGQPVVMMSLFRSCWAVLNCAFQLSSFLCIGTQALIFIFFCQTIFLLRISAYTLVKLQPATVTSQKLHMTWWWWLLALPSLLWTQTSEQPCKSSEWLLLRAQQLKGPLCHLTFLMWYFKINFWLQDKWIDQKVDVYTF